MLKSIKEKIMRIFKMTKFETTLQECISHIDAAIYRYEVLNQMMLNLIVYNQNEFDLSSIFVDFIKIHPYKDMMIDTKLKLSNYLKEYKKTGKKAI